jgi:hypothetical protein
MVNFEAAGEVTRLKENLSYAPRIGVNGEHGGESGEHGYFRWHGHFGG